MRLLVVIAVVEDSDGLRVATGRLLRAAGYQTGLFASAEAYLAAPRAPARHCLVLDVHLPGMSGFDLLRHLRAHPPVPPIVFTTADRSVAAEAERLGCDAVLLKPVLAETLLSTLSALVE